ncbi:MAG: hypothetical protein ABJK39_09900 [Hyphomicrobiales bacterium]
MPDHKYILKFSTSFFLFFFSFFVTVDKTKAQTFSTFQEACTKLVRGPIASFADNEPVTFQTLKTYAVKAVEFCKQAVISEPENHVFQYNLGRALIAEGRNFNEAVEWFQKSASAGYAPAQNAIGVAYSRGYGVPLNDEIAWQWMQKAASQNYPPAITNTGAFHTRGFNNKQNYSHALLAFSKAEALGDPIAMTNIGIMYYHGYGVVDNLQQAEAWYRKGLAAGDIEAALRLRDVFFNAQFKKFIKIAVDAGHRNAALDAAGYDVPIETAIKLAQQGSIHLRYEHGFLYTRTLTTDHDASLFWTIMFDRRAKRPRFTPTQAEAILRPIRRRANCVGGKLFLIGEGIMGCSR